MTGAAACHYRLSPVLPGSVSYKPRSAGKVEAGGLFELSRSSGES